MSEMPLHTVAAQELVTLTEAYNQHCSLHTLQLLQSRGCDVPLKLIRKYFRVVASVSYLKKHELFCLYSLLNVAIHT